VTLRKSSSNARETLWPPPPQPTRKIGKTQVKVFSAESITEIKKKWRRIGGWKIYGRKREEKSGIPAGMQQPNERKLSAALGIWQRLWRRICNHHADFHKQPASSESKANRKLTEDTST